MEEYDSELQKRLHSKISYSRYRAEPGSTFSSLLGPTDSHFESLRKTLLESFAEMVKAQPQDIFLEYSVTSLIDSIQQYVLSSENFDPATYYSEIQMIIDNVRSFLETILHNIQTNMIVAENLNTIDGLTVNLSTAELDLKGQFEKLDTDLTAVDSSDRIKTALSAGQTYSGRLFKIVDRIQQFELYFVLSEDELAQALERIPDKAGVNVGIITRRAKDLFDFFQSIRSMLASMDSGALFQGDQEAVK